MLFTLPRHVHAEWRGEGRRKRVLASEWQAVPAHVCECLQCCTTLLVSTEDSLCLLSLKFKPMNLLKADNRDFLNAKRSFVIQWLFALLWQEQTVGFHLEEWMTATAHWARQTQQGRRMGESLSPKAHAERLSLQRRDSSQGSLKWTWQVKYMRRQDGRQTLWWPPCVKGGVGSSG